MLAVLNIAGDAPFHEPRPIAQLASWVTIRLEEQFHASCCHKPRQLNFADQQEANLASPQSFAFPQN